MEVSTNRFTEPPFITGQHLRSWDEVFCQVRPIGYMLRIKNKHSIWDSLISDYVSGSLSPQTLVWKASKTAQKASCDFCVIPFVFSLKSSAFTTKRSDQLVWASVPANIYKHINIVCFVICRCSWIAVFDQVWYCSIAGFLLCAFGFDWSHRWSLYEDWSAHIHTKSPTFFPLWWQLPINVAVWEQKAASLCFLWFLEESWLWKRILVEVNLRYENGALTLMPIDLCTVDGTSLLDPVPV